MDNNDFMKCVNDGEYSLIRNEYLKELENYKRKYHKHEAFENAFICFTLGISMLLLLIAQLF